LRISLKEVIILIDLIIMKKISLFSISFFLFLTGIFCFSVLSFVLPAKEIIVKGQLNVASISSGAEGFLNLSPDDEGSRLEGDGGNNIKAVFIDDYLEKKKKELISGKKDFLFLDLEKMTAKVFKAGEDIRELSIEARGGAELWGGTPLGIYYASSNRKLAYSSSAKVFMPFSVGFYGKYFIHGECYYPDGAPDLSSITGGCVRFLDEDAEYLHNFVKIGMPILITDKGFKNNGFGFFPKSISPFPDVSAKSYLLADLDSGYVFSEKNSQDKLPIASITKLMMSVVVVENADLKESILATEKMLVPYGSTEGLVAGKEYKLTELLYAALTESSNDAAETLSNFLGKSWTIRMMNEKAKAIGMENSYFTEPTGLEKENVSTAKDLFQLGRYVFSARNPLFEITKGEDVRDFGAELFKDLKNKNVLFDNSDFLGGKTGFILASNYNGLFLMKFSDADGAEHNVAIIILGSDSLEKNIPLILGWVKDNFFASDKDKSVKGIETKMIK